MRIRRTINEPGVNAAIAVNIGEGNADDGATATTTSQHVSIVQRGGRTTIRHHDRADHHRTEAHGPHDAEGTNDGSR